MKRRISVLFVALALLGGLAIGPGAAVSSAQSEAAITMLVSGSTRTPTPPDLVEPSTRRGALEDLTVVGSIHTAEIEGTTSFVGPLQMLGAGWEYEVTETLLEGSGTFDDIWFYGLVSDGDPDSVLHQEILGSITNASFTRLGNVVSFSCSVRYTESERRWFRGHHRDVTYHEDEVNGTFVSVPRPSDPSESDVVGVISG